MNQPQIGCSKLAVLTEDEKVSVCPPAGLGEVTTSLLGLGRKISSQRVIKTGDEVSIPLDFLDGNDLPCLLGDRTTGRRNGKDQGVLVHARQ